MKKINVMLLGDSVRMLTETRLRERLGENFEVWSPTLNCRHTALTLNELRYYLRDCPSPDVFHWNNGLWDTAILYDDGNFITLPVYLQNLERILRQLKKTGAKIIFATTTPTHPKKEHRSTPTDSIHYLSDIEKYNEAAVALMKREGVEINDLYPLLLDDLDRYIDPVDLIHPTQDGIEILSSQMAAKITEVAKTINKTGD